MNKYDDSINLFHVMQQLLKTAHELRKRTATRTINAGVIVSQAQSTFRVDRSTLYKNSR